MRHPLTYAKILINYYECSHPDMSSPKGPTEGPASLSSKSSFSIMPAQFPESEPEEVPALASSFLISGGDCLEKQLQSLFLLSIAVPAPLESSRRQAGSY